MIFDERKAQYGYKIYTSGEEIVNDVDMLYQVKCNDGLFRFFALEVKHPNERVIGGQLFALSKVMPQMPILVVEMNCIRTKTLFIDGKITDQCGKLVDTTKTAWTCSDECIIKDAINLDKGYEYIDKKVSEFVQDVKAGKVPCMPCFPVSELQSELESFKKRNEKVKETASEINILNSSKQN